jgi:hypothetical protein
MASAINAESFHAEHNQGNGVSPSHRFRSSAFFGSCSRSSQRPKLPVLAPASTSDVKTRSLPRAGQLESAVPPDWRSYFRFTSTSSASSRDFNSAFSFSSFRVFASSALMPARVMPSASTELIVVGPRPTPKAL